jgi:hypothetical protein
VDFGGLKKDCVSCHADTHEGDLGRPARPHSTERFAVTTYAHRTPGGFFEGTHAPLACAKCHAPSGTAKVPVLARTTARPAPAGTAPAIPRGPLADAHFTATPRTCVTCHADVHLGQVAQTCESCHSVALAKFAVAPTFDHARTKFPLGGKHGPVACAKCHEKKTQTFPTGPGTAARLTGLATTCVLPPGRPSRTVRTDRSAL